jgi:hypothetical protein
MQKPKTANQVTYGSSKRCDYAPFRGRGIFGSGWQRQTCSLINTAIGGLLFCPLPALFRASSPIFGDRFAVSVSSEAARFLVKRTVVGTGVDTSDVPSKLAGFKKEPRRSVNVVIGER